MNVVSGTIKNLMQNAALEMETTKFASTTEVWNAFLKYRKLRAMGIEASDFALEMVAVPDDVMSNIYYILNQ